MVRWPTLTRSGFYNIKVSEWVKGKDRGKTVTTSPPQKKSQRPCWVTPASYTWTSSVALLKSLILYHLSHSGRYPVQHTRYSMARPLLFLTVCLLRRRLISKDLCLSVSPSTNTKGSCCGRGRWNRSSDGLEVGSSWVTEKIG